MAKRSRLGTTRLSRWTPERAHAFAMRRINKIELLLQEIAATYGDVDETIVWECDELVLTGLKESLDDALVMGRTP